MPHLIKKIAGVNIPPEFSATLNEARAYYLQQVEAKNAISNVESASFSKPLTKIAPSVSPTQTISSEEVAAVGALIGPEFAEILRDTKKIAATILLSAERQFQLYEMAKERIKAEVFHQESLLIPAIRMAKQIEGILFRSLTSYSPGDGRIYEFADYFKVTSNPRFGRKSTIFGTVREIEKIWDGKPGARSEHTLHHDWTTARFREEMKPRLDTLISLLASMDEQHPSLSQYDAALRTLRKILPAVQEGFHHEQSPSGLPSSLKTKSIFERENGPLPKPIDSLAAKVSGLALQTEVISG